MSKKKQLQNALKTLMALSGLLNFNLIVSKSKRRHSFVKQLKECAIKTNLLILEILQALKLDLNGPDCRILIDEIMYRANVHQEYCVRVILDASKSKGDL